VARERCDRHAVATLGLESHPGRIGRGVEDLIAQAVVWRARDADGDRDAWCGSAVRLGKEMTPHRGAEPFRHVARRRRRRAKQRHELVSAGMRNQLSFAEVGSSEIEDRAQHALRIRLAVVVGEVAVVVDVRDEKGDRPFDGTRLGDGDRGSVDEGVVCSEPSLLVEKNGMLLRAGAAARWWLGQP